LYSPALSLGLGEFYSHFLMFSTPLLLARSPTSSQARSWPIQPLPLAVSATTAFCHVRPFFACSLFLVMNPIRRPFCVSVSPAGLVGLVEAFGGDFLRAPSRDHIPFSPPLARMSHLIRHACSALLTSPSPSPPFLPARNGVKETSPVHPPPRAH